MNSRLTDQLLPLAENAIQEAGIIKNNTVSNEMRGYVSGFCVNSLESLTMAVLSFNKDEKKKIADAVNRMLKAARNLAAANQQSAFPGILDLEIKESGLYETIKANPNKKNLLREYCICCAVAIKLLLQMYTVDGGE